MMVYSMSVAKVREIVWYVLQYSVLLWKVFVFGRITDRTRGEVLRLRRFPNLFRNERRPESETSLQNWCF